MHDYSWLCISAASRGRDSFVPSTVDVALAVVPVSVAEG